VSCIERDRRFIRRARLLGLGLAALLAGCASAPPPPKPAQVQPRPNAPAEAAQPAAPAAPLTNAGEAAPKLAPPKPSRTLDELRRQAALRLVAANPDRTYMGEPPPILLAIPVLEIELYNDGRVKRINILRKPGQAPETLQMAIEAIHRAAPFGDVSRMPEPHKFVETFLFNAELRFKPRTLD
jgi:hypothetical protein